MGSEINLLSKYPRSPRNVKERGRLKTDEDRAIARQFGQEFFDGDRKYGYGGHYYDQKYWKPVVPDFFAEYGLGFGSSVLDVGCAKGFMLRDFREFEPGLIIAGADVSEYAVEHADELVKPYLYIENAKSLPFQDNSFDLVICINTVHNLALDECGQALQEIQRVTKGNAFVVVDAYRTEEERHRIQAWNLTAQTIMHTSEWVSFFNEVGYTGDYYWFFP